MRRVFARAAMAVMVLMLLQPSLPFGERVIAKQSILQNGQQAVEKTHQSRVAIVIDDFGNNMKGTEEMFRLPVPITAAVMPFMPTTREDAEAAHRLGLDVIVHMPMEPNQGKSSWLGPGALLSTMSDAEVRDAVEKAIDAVPHAVGMNNHMGSKITADERIMRVVLAVCKEKGLFFLDSRTTYKTVIPKVAKELGIPLLHNDVFLDDVYSPGHISKQISILKQKSKEQADCITIGHVGAPGLLTSSALRQAASAMSGIHFVRASELLPASVEEKLVLPHS